MLAFQVAFEMASDITEKVTPPEVKVKNNRKRVKKKRVDLTSLEKKKNYKSGVEEKKSETLPSNASLLQADAHVHLGTRCPAFPYIVVHLNTTSQQKCQAEDVKRDTSAGGGLTISSRRRFV